MRSLELVVDEYFKAGVEGHLTSVAATSADRI
jgi:hypothetical protein